MAQLTAQQRAQLLKGQQSFNATALRAGNLPPPKAGTAPTSFQQAGLRSFSGSGGGRSPTLGGGGFNRGMTKDPRSGKWVPSTRGNTMGGPGTFTYAENPGVIGSPLMTQSNTSTRKVASAIKGLTQSLGGGGGGYTLKNVPITYKDIPRVPTQTSGQALQLEELLKFLGQQRAFGGGAFTPGATSAQQAGAGIAQGAASGPEYDPSVTSALQGLLEGGTQFPEGVQGALQGMLSGEPAYQVDPAEDVKLFKESYAPAIREAFGEEMGGFMRGRGKMLFSSGTEQGVGRLGEAMSEDLTRAMGGIFASSRERQERASLAGQQNALGALGVGQQMGQTQLQGLLGGLGIGQQMGEASGQQALGAAGILGNIGGQVGAQNQQGLATLLQGLLGATGMQTTAPGDVAPANQPFVLPPGQQNVSGLINSIMPLITSMMG